MSSGRVLVLEDDGLLRAVLVEVLESDGWRVMICQGYEDLVNRAEAGEGEVVLADFWGASHLELSAADRDDLRRLASAVPLVLTTGRAWAGDLTEQELGLAAVISKPFDLDTLLSTLERVVRAR